MANEYIGGGAAAGAHSAAQGIGSTFKAIAMAPMVARQAEQNTAMTLAKIFANQQAGSKHEQEARGLKMTNDYRAKIEDQISANPNMPEFEKRSLRSLQAVGPGHVADFSRGTQIEQKIASIEDIKRNPSLATAAAQAYFATSGSAPFDNVANTGTSINRVTGSQVVSDPALKNIYENRGAGKGKKAESPEDSRRTDIAEENQIRLQYNTEFPLTYGQRPKDAPPFQEYLKAAKERRGANKNPAPSTSGQTIKHSQPFTPTADMLRVHADFNAGKITKDQATQKLKELGMHE